MTIDLPNLNKLEWTAVIVILLVTATEVFATIGPYFGFHPTGDQSSLSQQSTIMQNVFISCVSFLIGASVGTRKKDDTISAQAAMIATTGPAVVPSVPSVPLHTGDSATAVGP